MDWQGARASAKSQTFLPKRSAFGAQKVACTCGVCAACLTREKIENARFARHVDPGYYLRRPLIWRSTLGGGVGIIRHRTGLPSAD